MRTLSSGTRFAFAAALVLGGAATAPLACLFPSYTYDLPNGGGATASSSSTSTGTMASTSSGSTGGSSSSGTTGTTSGTGGATTTTTTTTTHSCASADCSDPACTGAYLCVPTTPPAGWTGYFQLFDGMPAQFQGCGTLFPTMGYSGNNQIMVQPAMCNCDCGAPTGQACSLQAPADTNPQAQMILPNATDPIITADAPCGMASVCSGPLLDLAGWNGTCDGYNYYSAGVKTCQPTGSQDCTMGSAACNQSIVANALQVTGGSCTANPQPPTIPPVSWSTLGQACGGATAGTGCSSSSESCMPVPQSPFHSGLCIMQAGNVSCTGQFSEQHLFYGGSMDTRTCSTCTCGAPSGGTCTATVEVYATMGGTNCGGTPLATLHPTTQSTDCANLTGNPEVGSKKASFSAVTGGTCAGTAQPSGTATPTNPTTFCCIP